MKPRDLRHRLEKSAKLLVTIQKYLPDVDTRFADDKAESGQVIINSSYIQPSETQLKKLGQDLEGKGYQFKKLINRWLGNITYLGQKKEQPDIIIEIATQVDRLNHAGDSTPEPYSFRS